jgi:hypothetical protein
VIRSARLSEPNPFQFGSKPFWSANHLAAHQYGSFPRAGPSRNLAINLEAELNATLGCAVVLILVFDPVLFARHAHSADNIITVQMQRDTNYWMVGVRCQVSGGSGKWHVCVIDSGASHTIISDKVLKAEGPSIDVTTGNGVIQARARHVRLTIAEGLQVDSLALVQSDMTPSDVEILLGQDVLRQFRSVNFNYEKQQVEFCR